MEILKQVFYWTEKLGKYGNAIANIAAYAKAQFEEIHPELKDTVKTQENENS